MKAEHPPVRNRKHALTEEQRQEIVRLNREGKLSWNQLAHQYAVSRMTIYRIIKRSSNATPEEAVSNEATSQQQTHDMRPRVYSSYG